MDSIRLGELSLDAQASGIRFTCHDDEQRSVVVAAHEIPALVAFLEEHGHDERRIGFRVPLGPLSPSIREAFLVTVSRRGKEAQAVPVDISLTGVLLEVTDLKLRPGQRVQASLSLHDNCVLLAATVVRRTTKLVALHFPSCIRRGELDPPEELLEIYRALELDWLRSRTST